MAIHVLGKSVGNELLRPFIQSESAFRVEYASGWEITVAFHKGFWFFVRRKGLDMSEVLQLGDGGHTQSDDGESLSLALLNSIKEKVDEVDKAREFRTYPATILIKFFDIWGGTELKRVEVIQVGRNSHIDPGGVLKLSPEV